MYAVSRRFRFDPASARQVNDEIERFFVPMIKSTPGLVAYFWVDCGEGLAESLSVYETRLGAETSVTIAATWARTHQLFQILGVPEVVQGEVKGHAVAALRPT